MHVIIAGNTYRLSMQGDARLVHKSPQDVPYDCMMGPYISASLKGVEQDYSAELRIRFGELLKLVRALSLGASNELHMCLDFLEQNELWAAFEKFKEQKTEEDARSAATVS